MSVQHFCADVVLEVANGLTIAYPIPNPLKWVQRPDKQVWFE